MYDLLLNFYANNIKLHIISTCDDSIVNMTIDIKINQIRANADKASNLLKVLSNPDRLLIVCQIGQGEKCVKELEELVEVCQPTLSQQLTVLRNEGLVKTRKEGKKIYYSLNSDLAASVIEVLYTYYCKPE